MAPALGEPLPRWRRECRHAALVPTQLTGGFCLDRPYAGVMREPSASIDVPAPPATVWEVLTDVAAYPRWNTLLRVRGT
ncbi:SRPBCC family protein [Halomicroarcula sp. GCM10025710]